MTDSKFAFKKQNKYYIRNVNYKRKETLAILNLKDTIRRHPPWADFTL